MTAQLLLALALVGQTGAGQPGAPAANVTGSLQPTILDDSKSDDSLPETPAFGYTTTLNTMVIPGTLVLLESGDPATEMAAAMQGILHQNLWSDVIFFGNNTDNKGTANLFSSDDLSDVTSIGTNFFFMSEAAGPEVTPDDMKSHGFTVYKAGAPGNFNTFMIESVGAVPEPTGMTLVIIGAVGLVGCGWRRKRAAQDRHAPG